MTLIIGYLNSLDLLKTFQLGVNQHIPAFWVIRVLRARSPRVSL